MSDARQRRIDGRRAAVVASAAAAVALSIGVPAVVTAVSRGPGGADGRTDGRHQTIGGTARVPDGWRVESWGDLTWAVPGDWEYGTLDQWCALDGGTRTTPAPVVQRPDGVSTLVGCLPARGLGLQVSVGDPQPPTDPAEYVEGAAIGQRRFGQVTLTVSTADAELTARVLGTAHRYEGRDPNGCPAAAVPVALGDGGARSAPTAGRLSVCRYVRTGPDDSDDSGGWVLAQSELLTATESATARWALSAAPRGGGPDADPNGCSGWEAEQVVALRTSAGEVAWVHYDGCSGHGVELLGDGVRRLTVEVLRWAFTPGWSGGVDGAVPTPARFGGPTR
jgi:hypothetical protein